MKRIFILFFLVLAFIIASTTCVLAAGKPILPGKPIQPITGEWTTIGTRSCVQTVADGIGPPPQFQLSSGGTARVMQEVGTLSLFGDGTGLWVGNAVQINYTLIESGSYPVMGFTYECDVAYEPWYDGIIKFKFDNCVTNYTAGFLGSDSQSYNAHFRAEFARLSADGLTMVIWDLEPIVERTWTTTGGITTNFDRICSRTKTAIKFR